MTDDLGLAAIEAIREALSVDDEWALDDDRGFTWWAGDLAQFVWSDAPLNDDGIVIWRLHARTDLVRDVGDAADSELLSRLNALSPLSCLAFHPTEARTLQLVSSVYVHEESLEWVTSLFQLATAFQVADAHAIAHALADALQGEVAATVHPERGRREEPDEMLSVVDALPLREGGSRFAGAELEGLAQTLMAGPSVLATSDRDRLSAEFPFRDRTSLLQIETRDLHPRLGAGVRMTLTLPSLPRTTDPAEEALELNGLELRDLTRAHLLGGWCLTPEEEPSIAFHAFFPNAAYRPGVLTNLALSMAMRAAWVNEQVATSGSAGGVRELPHIEPRPLLPNGARTELSAEDVGEIGSFWNELGLGSSPGFDEASRYFFAESFNKTSAKWLELYSARELDPEIELVLRWMTARVEETAAGGAIFNDDALSAVLSMGVGGYLWRLAERESGRVIGDHWDEVAEAIGRFEEDGTLADTGATPNQAVLYQASARCIEANAPLWRTAPGNLVWGLDFFKAGERFVAQQTGADRAGVEEGDLFYAFYFGVALFHAESQLAAGDGWRPGELAGSEWEECEIVLDAARRVFVAEADGPGGRYDVAMSERVPSFRFSIGLLEGRAYDKLEKRYESLVSRLEREGWVKTTQRGEEWWSQRFRRRRT